MNSASQKLVIILLALVALAAGVLLSQSLKKPDNVVNNSLAQTKIPGLLWPNPKQITPFQLIDQNTKTFDLESLKGHWSMIFFGYTHCPDICPTTMTLMNSIVNELSEEKQPAPQIIFVTVDPERDTQKHLSEYVTYFNPAFIGLTGSEENIAALTKQIGILSMKIPNKDSSDESEYLMDHSASVLLIGPKARLIGIFSAPHSKADIKQRYLAMRSFIDNQ